MQQYLFSIITPTHSEKNLPFLIELWDSILAQTYVNWQWVLFLNNGITPDSIPDNIKNHAQVKMFWSFDTNTNVGKIKNQAFSIGDGDILVEVDHDDILMPSCLEKLNEAYQNSQVGFVYSDAALYDAAANAGPFDAGNGWTWRKFAWRDRELVAHYSFQPTSHSMSYIWYAPDHVRSWRRSVYTSLGGHNPELDVCDDHELMIRTYLNTQMVLIPEVLYVYRITGNNTWLERNQQIQERTRQLHRQWAPALAQRDADLRGLKKIDLGGGRTPVPGCINIDLCDGADIRADLNDGIPLPDNSVGCLHANHIIEHVRDKQQIMSEIYRVLAHGGWAFIEVPSTDGRGAWQDPTHVTFWNENSFLYYTDRYLADFIGNDRIRFQEYRRETHYPNEWMQKLQVLVTSAWLVAIKDGPRLPGPLTI